MNKDRITGNSANSMTLSRRHIMQLAGFAPALSFLPSHVEAQTRLFRHGATLIEPLKYAEGFKHFNYVNPQAPKGGSLKLATLGTFDSVNSISSKGAVAATGVNETLMLQPLDEPSSEYGLIAESFWYPEDYSEVVFKLRPEARFHDGMPITPEDVIFSLDVQKANNAQASGYYKDIVSAEKTGDHEVRFVFGVKGNRELPNISGQLAIMPKHWWTGKDANGKQRDPAAPTLEFVLGSGPYEISVIQPGSFYRLRRVADYWGKNLAVNAGKHNFDEVEVQFYLDRTVMLEAFKGGKFDIIQESSSKQWATSYDFPAVKDGRVKREELPRLGVSGMQSWALNTRRAKFQDVRVRKALNLAFDFEWSNTNLFYGVYTRSRSYFNNSEFEAKGLPDADELALLEPLRDKIPPEVFTTEYSNPTNTTPQDRRKNMREAQRLLGEAGWKASDEGSKRVLKNAKDEIFEINFILDAPAFERVALPYKEQLQFLGFVVNIKLTEAAQYERMKENFEFDIIVGSWAQSLSPGNEQRGFFGSEFADKMQSQNYVGIKNPAIDVLIDKIILAPNRKALVTAVRAMDRVLMANHYVVPMWYKATDWLAYWSRVRHPENMPGYALGYPDIWWFDAEADAKLKKT
jgi:microcin C transport system substrate-binding protein